MPTGPKRSLPRVHSLARCRQLPVEALVEGEPFGRPSGDRRDLKKHGKWPGLEEATVNPKINSDFLLV